MLTIRAKYAIIKYKELMLFAYGY